MGIAAIVEIRRFGFKFRGTGIHHLIDRCEFLLLPPLIYFPLLFGLHLLFRRRGELGDSDELCPMAVFIPMDVTTPNPFPLVTSVPMNAMFSMSPRFNPVLKK